MALYYAVKLTVFGKDGKINPKAKTYGIINCSIGNHNHYLGFQELQPSLMFTNPSPRTLGLFYSDLIKDKKSSPDEAPLSFRSPFDIIPSRDGKKIYNIEDFPSNLRAVFIKSALEDLIQT